MAKKMNAVQAYSPRLKLLKPVEISEVSEFISGRTGRVKSTIKEILGEIHESLLFFLSMGKPVKLEDVGIFRPVLANDGSLRINFLPDQSLIKKFNNKGIDSEIKCKDMIGTTREEKITRWNNEHPDDPVGD